MPTTNRTFSVKNGLDVANTIVISNTSGVLNISNIQLMNVVNLNTSGNINTSGTVNVTGAIMSNNGVLAGGTWTPTFSDGVVIDYVNNNGRVSVGSGDSLTIYTGGVGTTTMMNISSTGANIVGVTYTGNANANVSAWSGSYQLFSTQNANTYGSVGVQNRYGPGANASADFVAISDDGNDTTFYIDMGINNSGANDAVYPALTKRDSYVIGSGNATNTSNMTIGTGSQSSNLQFIVGGFANNNIAMWITPVPGGGGNVRIVGNVSTNQNLSVTQNGTFGNISTANIVVTNPITQFANNGVYVAGTLVANNPNINFVAANTSNLSITGTSNTSPGNVTVTIDTRNPPGSGGGAPASPNLSIQVNVAGTMTGNANVLYNVANQSVYVEANLQIANANPLYFGGNQSNTANAQFYFVSNVSSNSLDLWWQ